MKRMKDTDPLPINEPSISDPDVYEAMKEIEGYLDISAQDFRELYKLALRHAKKRILHSTKVAEVMTTDVMSITGQATLQDIISAMATRAISGVPVVNGKNEIVGVVSEKDIFARLGGSKDVSFWRILSGCLHTNRCLLRSIVDTTAADIMTTPAVTVKPEDTLQSALQLIAERQLNRLPVADDDNVLVGIVTRTDLLKAFMES